MKVLVTGSAGFIGFHTSQRLLSRGDEVIGLDNLNAYYDPTLKRARLNILEEHRGYRHLRVDLADRNAMEAVFREHRPERTIHLAAQAGVRYSLEHPHTYVDSNIVGFLNVLEGCRHQGSEHLVFASTSSAYGANGRMPFRIEDSAEHPLTIYAATKKANEVMAHSYAHLFRFPATGVRFFTVYGPWGRPDMALFKFTKAMLENQAIDVYGEGNMSRDFTYVDDISNGLVLALDRPAVVDPDWDAAAPNPATSGVAPFRLYNLGNTTQVPLMHFIQQIEKQLGVTARKNMLPMQAGDVPQTWADIETTRRALGYEPRVSVETGVKNFVDWYLRYFKVNR